MKKIIILLSFLALSFEAFAGIRVYNPQTGKNMDSTSLINTGVIEADTSGDVGGLTDEEKKEIILKDIDERLGVVKKNIERQKKLERLSLGQVYVFTDITTFDKQNVKVLNKMARELKKVDIAYFVKPIKNPRSLIASDFRADDDLEYYLKEDRDEKTARKLHVTRYPEVVYLEPNGVKSRYGLSKGGLFALKQRVYEIETLVQKQKESIEKSY